jgi:hypothetical protein
LFRRKVPPLSSAPKRVAKKRFDLNFQEPSSAMPVTGREGQYSCETSRFPHFLDNRLTDGGEVVRITRRPPFTPQEDSWYSFLSEAESTPGS